MLRFTSIFVLILCPNIFIGSLTYCQQNVTVQNKIIVDQNGHGDFKSIQGAINSLPDSASSPRTILIRNGLYAEKIYIEKSNIILEGEDREKTIIIASISRDEWRCGHTDDWGVATLNIGANDISLKSLTVTNNYGFDFI
ncbi:MAG: pectinesterase family protein, partial [Chitinophagaceae bacterium]